MGAKYSRTLRGVATDISGFLGKLGRRGGFIAFERGAGLNFRVKFLGGVRVRVKFFRWG